MPAIETATPEINTDNYQFLQKFVYDGSGIVLDQGKQYLLEARLTPIAKSKGLPSVNDLCALLKATSDRGLHRQVIEAMTTNETYFFREPTQYDAIKTILLPELIKHRQDTKKLNCWSAAASTGQESYSLAMLLLEQGLANWNIQILGTDLTTEVLDRARAARYMQIEVNRGLPATHLVKYFLRKGADWYLKDNVRQMVRFEQFDLRQKMRTFGPFDLVFCRNVLVYFDTPTRQKILTEIHGTLFRGGWLMLGTAEVTPGLDHLFERKSVGQSSYYVAK